MNNVLILVDSLDDWKPYSKTNSILTVSDYLKYKSPGKDRKLVINLSNDYSYNSEGYYCSLLAQTRGHKVIPGVDIINKVEAGAGIRMDSSLQKLCYQWIQKNEITDDLWSLNVYFGTCKEKGLERIARFIFENYPAPLLRVTLNTRHKNQIENIQFLPLSSLNNEEEDYFANALDLFNRKVWRNPQASKSARYNLAILYDPDEKFPPSDKKALHKLLELAKKMDIHAELLTEEDATRLMEFDALFIRTTTSLNHYTFRLSQLATQNGLAVIDDPQSIIRCTNKVYLKELFEKEKIPAPLSMLLFKSNVNSYEEITEQLGSPFILKIPDGSFSIGMKKVNNEIELDEALKVLFDKSSILLAQEFAPTDFDWRIGILNGELSMRVSIIWLRDIGKSIAIILPDGAVADWWRLFLFIKCHVSIGYSAARGFFYWERPVWRDLKMVNDRAIVIEINDNPSIDHGLEDAILGDELYYRLLNNFWRMLDVKRF